jgi:hypothetical protein
VQRDLSQLAKQAMPSELNVNHSFTEIPSPLLNLVDVCFVVDDHQFLCHKVSTCLSIRSSYVFQCIEGIEFHCRLLLLGGASTSELCFGIIFEKLRALAFATKRSSKKRGWKEGQK